MKKFNKIIFCFIFALVMPCVFMLGGCFSERVVTDIVQTSSDGATITYTVYYSDGTSNQFFVTNGINGQNGESGKDLDINDIYKKYVEENGEISYEEFLEKFLSFSIDYSDKVANILCSTMKLYTEFVETQYSQGFFGQTSATSDAVLYTGSAVIWSIDESEEGYTYILTNYHVVFSADANETLNGGSKIARKIYCYMYGSENKPSENGKDSDGYTQYNYGDYSVACEYIGGSIVYDIALVRAKTSSLKAINDGIKPVELADDYHVGQTAIAVGNSEDYGLSVTQGIVSVENEDIILDIDGTSRTYRSIRMDTAIYGGNSGGGLFNSTGKLIGLTNAGNTSDENINFAIPVDIIKPCVENILYYYNDGNDETNGVYIFRLGVTVTTKNSRYEYDADSGYGNITEEVVVYSVSDEDCPAKTLNFQKDDIFVSIIVKGKEEYNLTRSFLLSDVFLTLRAGDTVKFKYIRNGSEFETEDYVISFGVLVKSE